MVLSASLPSIEQSRELRSCWLGPSSSFGYSKASSSMLGNRCMTTRAQGCFKALGAGEWWAALRRPFEP
ncbi:hypothetical protein AMECASPLE_012425 [Ameca splendens]|uniref:Uncharacterized protein n=1 Tax=Ameca splendens TaxID=208324 RepID=A0ABV0ZA92_9TELE